MLHYKQKMEEKNQCETSRIEKIIREINFIFMLSRITSKTTYSTGKGIGVLWGEKAKKKGGSKNAYFQNSYLKRV